MALESFGVLTAERINHAVILCHDLLKDHSPSTVNSMFQAGEDGIWRVRAAYTETGISVVVIELGVG